MSEYGSGITLEKAFEYDRERIEHAMNGELICGETENGFEYAPAGEGACKEYILSAFDNAVYQCNLLLKANRVLENMLHERGVDEREIVKEYIRNRDDSL